ncbi:hypothetical protein BZG36_01531 [Bifiguratus adelaidae]|uniref:BHLH domain-containing protein n=1 Tax=Bifiguratus adelaidae TaxID=1938954 RepID=A0A261Y401_9FUNG|nr:hypothetical protein BZG36_01531 [Bifiguratus adelaidae]
MGHDENLTPAHSSLWSTDAGMPALVEPGAFEDFQYSLGVPAGYAFEVPLESDRRQEGLTGKELLDHQDQRLFGKFLDDFIVYPEQAESSRTPLVTSDTMSKHSDNPPPKRRKKATESSTPNAKSSSEEPTSLQRIKKRNPKELLTPEEKRINHIVSEQKRREAIRTGYRDLAELIPRLQGEGSSKSSILFKAVDFIKHLEKRNARLRDQLDELHNRPSQTPDESARYERFQQQLEYYRDMLRQRGERVPPVNKESLDKLQHLLAGTAASQYVPVPFVKLVKNKAYFKRFQVKYRRRREGKTDYYARKRLVVQAKNKYNSPKYRLVVRFTNKDIICQIVYAKLQGDFVLAAAYSHELPRYGIKVGLTNWSAAYATGLLVARRLLQKLGLDDKYEGVTEPDGTLVLTEPLEDGPKPFKAFLDVGLKRTSTGAKVFGAMKGASDGGLYIPHSESRFPGYDMESKSLDAEVLSKYIYGGHVAEYMEELEEEDEEQYKKHFASFVAEEITSADLEDMYREAHEAIRADPSPKLTEKKKPAEGEKVKKYKGVRLNKKQRDNKVLQKKLYWEKNNL